MPNAEVDIAADTSKEQFDAMEAQLAKARSAFNKAASLRPNSALPLAALIDFGLKVKG